MYKQSFKTWIKKFQNDDSPLGDLAQDIRVDKEFPSFCSKNRLMSYLMSKNACDEALTVFEKAYEAYSREIKKG
jgi:uncharacterized protein YozE (UPF0346 family)